MDLSITEASPDEKMNSGHLPDQAVASWKSASQEECSLQGAEEGNNSGEFTSAPASSRFEVDVNEIESVTVEDQDADIQALGLTVYDQSALERGIWDQVERETRKREAKEELANVSTKLKLAEEQLKRVESATSLKRSILQEALEEPSRKRPTSKSFKKHEGVTKEKVKELRLKQAELQAQLNNKIPSKNEDSKQESERDRKIRMGEMTPFGTIVNAPSSDLSSFEKYLKSQQDLHNKMLSSGMAKKKTSAAKSVKKEKWAEVSQSPIINKKSPNKPILKKSILFPKKRKGKEKLGTGTSVLEDDQQQSPGETPAENAVVNFEDSGSEYIPSHSEDDADFYHESSEKKKSSTSLRLKTDKHSSLQSSRKRNMSDRWAGGSLKQRKRNTKTVPDGDPEEWKSDDSDWICTDDEYYSSDNETRKKAKRNSKREKDDGNGEDFFRRIKQWEKQNEGLRDQLEFDVHKFENGFKISNIIWDKLYTYQQVGVRWMWELNQQRCGGILGDEMGLGKTIQIISFLAGLFISKLKCRTTGYRGLGPTLIVCPTTVMHQWVQEFHLWFPPLRVAILHESGSYLGKRSQLVRDMLHEKGVIITSYTAVVRLQNHLLHQRWHYVILDEGHKIRNPDAQVTLAVKQLRTPHRIILSGSPLQNNLRELWSLMDFVFPGKLGTLPVFMSEFAVPISQGGYSNASEVMVATAFKCATVLRDTIAPYLLRRMKADVSDHIKLPSKNEQVLFCRLTDDQRELYKGYLQCGEVGRILEGRCQIFVGLINLRKICNHPHLYSGGPKLFAHDEEDDLPVEERFGYWEKAGKMVVIEALLKMWHKQEHRVLIFTQSRQMLLIMEKFVNDKRYRYLKLDGCTSIAARQPLINKFNQDKSYFVMLLTTKVGGLGVNLTGANRVVIYDPDWNPATDTQARERAWRIGQQNAVTVYRLITAGTIEEKMYHRQIFKQFLCNKVLKDPRQRRFFKSNDLLELFTLKETDDGSTETSAIFAGTNSQVHVKSKQDNNKSTRDRKQSSNSHHSQKSRREKLEASIDSNGTAKHHKSEESTKVCFSQDKLEHMKRLAHELSLKFSSKVAAYPKDTINVDDSKEPLNNNMPKECNQPTEITITEAAFKEEPIKVNEPQAELNENDEIGGIEKHRSQLVIENECEECEGETSKTAGEYHCEAGTSGENRLPASIMADDSDEDMENMKQLARELSKELSQKVQAAAALNRPKVHDVDATQKCKPQLENERLDENSILISHASEVCIKGSETDASEVCEKVSEKPDLLPQYNSSCDQESNLKPQKSSASCSSSIESKPQGNLTHPLKRSHKSYNKKLGEHEKNSSRHKKSKKHKKHKHRDAIFEGERVRGLVKTTAIEGKTKEEREEEASHNSKQDDYVLRKLFAKTGIKTAMQHDKVMEAGHADYTLVEGEARKVAQDAVKAMKASRQQCWNPMSGQATWTGSSGTIRIPQQSENKPQPSRPKFGKKKIQKRTSSQALKDTEGVEEGGSSSLLARIRARNLLITEDNNGDTTQGPPPSVPDSNKELLEDIRTFVAFGASVDGRAATEEIINQFRDRLPVQSTALFKQMLMQICEFHRLPSGQGVWKLIPDFQW